MNDKSVFAMDTPALQGGVFVVIDDSFVFAMYTLVERWGFVGMNGGFIFAMDTPFDRN